jgi:hypothetical protein
MWTATIAIVPMTSSMIDPSLIGPRTSVDRLAPGRDDTTRIVRTA